MYILIRKMEPTEAKEVKKLGIKSFRSFESLFVPVPKEALVAVMDSKIVAAVIVKYVHSKNSQKTGYIDFAFVDRAYHNQGIGRQIYKAAIDYLWDQGCSHITALVKDDNVGSWSLFLKNGFERVSLYTLIKNIGTNGFWNHLIHTAIGWAAGMDLYLAESGGKAVQKEGGSFYQGFKYILVNFLISLIVIIRLGLSQTMVFAGALLLVLSLSILTGYLGTVFSKRKWKFRLVNCGFLISVFMFLLGMIYPMVGNWYPDHYENTGKFRKDLGIQAWVNWVGIFLFAFVSHILSPYYLFFNYVYAICYMLLIFRILAVYPFSGFGGSRVLAWNKAVYLVTGLLTLGVLWL